ncbi:cation transporter [Mycolicibacterium sp. CBM1]
MTEITADHERRIQLDVTGMTCRMCASHIAKQLNKVDGVRASVDFGTKTATIDTRDDIDTADLCAVVRKAGYGATERTASAIESAGCAVGDSRSPLRQLIEFVAVLLGWLGIRRGRTGRGDDAVS